MKRSTLIIGLVVCGVVYLFGREHTPVGIAPHATAPLPTINQIQQASQTGKTPAIVPKMRRPAPATTVVALMASHMPNHQAQLATLEREYRVHPGFRQLVADYNAEAGHIGRGETASLEALDQDAMAGAPAFGLFQAVQPRAEMLRAMEQHWHDERQRQREDNASP
jgi:hypothetical protein